MPNEIDVKRLRRKMTLCGQLAGSEISDLLDEIEALRECYAHAQTTMEFEIGLKRRAETAETELSALKEKMEKVKNWVENPPVYAIAGWLPSQFESVMQDLHNILDGKEG